jgi:TldD protein
MTEIKKNQIDSYTIPLESNDLEILRDIADKEEISYFNARFGLGQSTQLSLLKSISKSSNLGIGQGYSILAFAKGGWGLSIGKDFSKTSIVETFKQAAKLAKWSSKYSKESYEINNLSSKNMEISTIQKIPLSSIGPDEKMETLLDIEKQAYYDPRIVSTRVNYSDSEGQTIYYNNIGQFIRKNYCELFFSLQSVAKDGSNQQGFHKIGGGSGGFELLKKHIEMGKLASDSALELLNSKPAKPGKFNIIMDPKLCGTFIHEAFGHACEADAILAGESLLADKMNSKVGNDNINIIDDGTMIDEYGYSPLDDEGIEGRKTDLVKDGKLVGLIHSLETASKMGIAPTGNSRAMGYSVKPLVRMTNTYLAPGDASLDEMLSELKNGLLCVGWKYGYCDPVDGSFMFKMAKAYKIENGEKTQVIRDAAISGMTLDVLSKISLISKDLELDPGHCGKGGQSVPVGSGGPYTMIKDMVIGGQ